MVYDDNERKDVTLFGLHFSATQEEQRRLWMKLSLTPESKEWGIIRNVMNLTEAPIPQLVHYELAERMERADTAMTKLASRLIEEMLAGREMG